MSNSSKAMNPQNGEITTGLSFFFFFFFHIQVHLRQGVQVYYCLKRRQILSLSLEMDFCTLLPNAEGGKVCVYRGSGNVCLCMTCVSSVCFCIYFYYLSLVPWYIHGIFWSPFYLRSLSAFDFCTYQMHSGNADSF